MQASYEVTVTADDQQGGTASIRVTITVQDPAAGEGGGGGGGGPTPSDIDFAWNVSRDIEELDGGHDTPTGMWSNGATLWIAENGDGADDATYAYDLKTGERLQDREFELGGRNRAAGGSGPTGRPSGLRTVAGTSCSPISSRRVNDSRPRGRPCD